MVDSNEILLLLLLLWSSSSSSSSSSYLSVDGRRNKWAEMHAGFIAPVQPLSTQRSADHCDNEQQTGVQHSVPQVATLWVYQIDQRPAKKTNTHEVPVKQDGRHSGRWRTQGRPQPAYPEFVIQVEVFVISAYVSRLNVAWKLHLWTVMLNKLAKFGAQIFTHYWDIVIFVLGRIILTHPVCRSAWLRF